MTKVKFDFKPSDFIKGVRIKRGKKEELLNEIADFVETEVLKDIGDQRSPVNGRKFKQLSKDYAKIKKKSGAPPIPNLELEGDMLDSLQVLKTTTGLRLTVADSEQGKADGHNNFSGKSRIPERKFIPNASEGETFRPKIRKGIESIIKDYEADDA